MASTRRRCITEGRAGGARVRRGGWTPPPRPAPLSMPGRLAARRPPAKQQTDQACRSGHAAVKPAHRCGQGEDARSTLELADGPRHATRSAPRCVVPLETFRARSSPARVRVDRTRRDLTFASFGFGPLRISCPGRADHQQTRREATTAPSASVQSVTASRHDGC